MDFSASSAEKVLHYFEEITKIPRPSGHEEKIADYLEAFMNARGIKYSRDAKHNVFAVLPATEGREGEPAIMLQGHTDMVCEADEGKEWDVLNEGVTLIRDGDWLHADGTTLGGDDGFAVAVMLALLDGAAESHPKLECLFTSDEEVGLGGANAFDFAPVTAKKLVNLDSEEEDTILVSCAGGMRMDMMLRFDFMDCDGVALKLTIDGLAGGHSGADIHLNRANANRELAKALQALCRQIRVNLCAFEGGSKDNAITRSATAIFAVTDIKKATEILEAYKAELFAGLSDEDKAGFNFTLERVLAPEKMLSREDSRRCAEFVSILPYGALEFNNDLGIVETSANIGIVKLTEEGLSVSMLCRSASDEKLDGVDYIVTSLCIFHGAEKSERNRYPGWAYSKDSALCAEYADAYEKVFGSRPKVMGIHAGLECGIFKKKAPDMDMISIGANMHDIHTPRERMSISSCERIWKVLLTLLNNEK
ncbi:MAG: beta-Ala-His dipeptidase [Clostridia bacterium]|nr:beta-Ala-His dipeptidase [Clostridia bacterium]